MGKKKKGGKRKVIVVKADVLREYPNGDVNHEICFLRGCYNSKPWRELVCWKCEKLYEDTTFSSHERRANNPAIIAVREALDKCVQKKKDAENIQKAPAQKLVRAVKNEPVSVKPLPVFKNKNRPKPKIPTKRTPRLQKYQEIDIVNSAEKIFGQIPVASVLFVVDEIGNEVRFQAVSNDLIRPLVQNVYDRLRRKGRRQLGQDESSPSEQRA